MSGPDPAAQARSAANRARSWSRRFALQALYQWQLTAQDVGVIDAQFIADQDLSKADVAYFQELLHQIPARCQALDTALATCVDRPLAQLDPVERAILWIGAYELAYRSEVPYRVAINEAIELAKRFGAEQSHRFVNGVLDRLGKRLREGAGAR